MNLVLTYLPHVLALSATIYFLSRPGGWKRLSRRYPATAVPMGQRFTNVRGKVGYTQYKGLTVTVCAEGLHLRFVLARFFPPVLVPWSEIASVEAKTGPLSFHAVRIALVEPEMPVIRLIGNVGRAVSESHLAHKAGAFKAHVTLG